MTTHTQNNWPIWLKETDDQLRRGKHIILYGNVDDCFLGDSATLISLSQYLDKYFISSGYENILHYDIVDGLRWSGHSPTGRNIESSTKTRADGARTPEQDDFSRFSSENQEETRQEGTSDAFRGGENLRAPNEVADYLRGEIFVQRAVPSVVVFEYSDKLFTDTQRQDRMERELVVTLKKCIAEAVETDSPKMTGRKNSMVIVASQLGALPTWFYQEHPLLALIEIRKPSKPEREDYIKHIYPVITDNKPLPPDVQSEIIVQFTELTYDLTLHDLDAIEKMCVAEKITVETSQEMKKLITSYRFGLPEDPWEAFNAQTIKDAPEKMRNDVIGQDHAVTAIVDMLKSANVGVTLSPTTNQSGKPRGVFFFVGPTGVGKTALAKSLARLIFHDEHRMKSFDMSEYSLEHAAEKLTGSPPGFIGYEAGGQLTNYMRENPFSVLLFDEIEKADQKVWDKFLQILEDGRLTDSKGQTSYFSQSVIIFTSNIGSDTFAKKYGLLHEPPKYDDVQKHYSHSVTTSADNIGIDKKHAASSEPPKPSEVQEHYLESVKRHFKTKIGRPEILNRIGDDNILVFDILRPEFIDPIAKKFLNALAQSAYAKKLWTCIFDKSVCEVIKSQVVEKCLFDGGRGVRNKLEELVQKQLNVWLFDNSPAPGTTLRLSLSPQGHLLVKKQ